MKTFLIQQTPLALLLVIMAVGCSNPSGKSTEPTPTAAPAVPALDIREAALAGDVDTIRRHAALGSDLNAADPSTGSTPLIIAVTFGHPEAVRALIDGGAALNLQNNDGATALLTAAFLGRTESVKVLLDAGADARVRNVAGATALESVEAPFDLVRPIYDQLLVLLEPAGLQLDLDRIREERPRIAAWLRTHLEAQTPTALSR